MRFSLTLLLLASACGEGDDYQVQADDPANSAGSTGTSTAAQLKGRVCVVTDARAMAQCATTGAGGLAVSAGSNATTTADDGTFELTMPSNFAGQVAVSGAGVQPTFASSAAFANAMTAGTVTSVPVMNADTYQQMVLATGLQSTVGTGAIIASVTRGGLPVSGATITTTPAASGGAFYEGATPTGFDGVATGQSGIAWAPGIATGTASINITDPESGETTVGGVQVVDGGLTLTEVPLD